MNKIGVVKNPLSVIAIFAGVAEISGTGVLPFIAPENQELYIWFLISFPFSLVILFFLTLNWNHRVLYAPSDFESDESFLKSAKSSIPLKQDIADMEEVIKEKVTEIINSEDDNDNKSTLAEKITDTIKDSAFISIDLSQLTGKTNDVFNVPYVAFSSLNQLTNELYFLLEGAVKAYEYGYTWVIINSNTGEIIKNARMITGAEKGVPIYDNRSLKEVGILPGTHLEVVRP